MFTLPASPPSSDGTDDQVMDSAAINTYYSDSSEGHDNSWKISQWSSDPFVSSDTEDEYDTSPEFEADGFSDIEDTQANDHKDITKQPLSPFELLPSELIQEIASRANSDGDLKNLSLASPRIAERFVSDDSDVWKKRFLSLYDFPLIDSPHEFAIAYKLRRFVLRKFEGFGTIAREKARVQLETIKDMILGNANTVADLHREADNLSETYNPPKPYLPPPRHSKNLAALASPISSPWTITFASSALYRNKYTKYGHPNALFDTLQVVLSHLVLSQESAVAWHLSTRRDDYDLVRVYHFNQPLQAILKFLPEVPQKPTFQNPHFPVLQKPLPSSYIPSYELNMHTLLHIRNFWQRHLVDSTSAIIEQTYSSMAKALLAHGKMPQKWENPLQERIPLNTEWYGHYSCLHPWPKTRDDIEERQTCAEDWNKIDPMVLKFDTSTEDEDNSFWPPLFANIPLFQEVLPAEKVGSRLNRIFIRGIAPFYALNDAKEASDSAEDDPDPNTSKWHPFKASRLHGVVHDIPAEVTFGSKAAQQAAINDGEIPIPGWKHIVMILYKPSTRALLSVLEHAEEDYGGVANLSFNTADIWNADTDETSPVNQVTPQVASTPDVETSTTTNASPAESGSQDASEASDAQIEAQLKNLLEERIDSFTATYIKPIETQSKQKQKIEVDNPYVPSYAKKSKASKAGKLPPIWSPAHIRQLDDAFSHVQYMSWDDGTVDFAYAYEGVIIPGGKIMMGRYWRIHGVEGMGPGKEVGPDGAGVEIRLVQQPSCSDDDDTSGGNLADLEDEGDKRSIVKSGRRKKRRRTRRRLRNTASGSGEEDTSEEDERKTEQEGQQSKEPEYEFVTMVNGGESRPLNANKGLDRGPFIFWAG